LILAVVPDVRRTMVRIFGGTRADDDLVFPGTLLNDAATWTEIFDEGDEPCCFCDRPVDDRRFALGLAIRRAWRPGSVEYRFCHVECLRKTMHHAHKLG
jgi:hypothetical protein